MVKRSGYFTIPRAKRAQLRDDFGPAAVELFTMLLEDARVEPMTVQRNGVKLDIPRGGTLFSTRSAEKRLGRKRSTVHRALVNLRKCGEIVCETMGRKMKRGRGTLPTVVRLVHFESYRYSSDRARHAFGTWSEALERRLVEESSPREELGYLGGVGYEGEEGLEYDVGEGLEYEIGEGLEYEVGDGVEHYAQGEREIGADAAVFVLEHFAQLVTPPRERDRALQLIANLIAQEITPDDLIAAAERFVAACRRKGVEYRGRVVPETFFNFMYSRYLREGHRQ